MVDGMVSPQGIARLLQGKSFSGISNETVQTTANTGRSRKKSWFITGKYQSFNRQNFLQGLSWKVHKQCIQNLR